MKERLIGAAVLVAAAVILIPEMLSGPKREQASSPAIKSGEPPLKTYTIDLSQASSTPGSATAAPQSAPSTSAEVVEEPAPPPENSAPEGDAPVPAEPQSSVAKSAASEPPAVAETVEAAPSAAAQPPVATPAPAPESNKPIVLPPPPATAGKGWAVQLGTFKSQANAASVVKDMQGKGYEAFVTPVRSDKGTLYRVRIGPMKDRQTAADVLRKVKGSVAGAAVVAHP